MSKASQVRHRAQDFLKKGKLDRAIEEYKKLIQIDSRNPNLYNELGDLYLKAQDRVQAVSCFEKASVNYEKVALYNNAVAVCKKILRIVPNRLETVFKLGELKAKQKFNGEAAGYFSQYLQRVLAESMGATDGLQEKLELVVEYMRERDDVIGTVAKVYGELGFKVKAAELLDGLISRLEERGASQQAASYRDTMDSMKSSLSRDELATLSDRLSDADAQGEEKTEREAQPGGARREAAPERIESAAEPSPSQEIVEARTGDDSTSGKAERAVERPAARGAEAAAGSVASADRVSGAGSAAEIEQTVAVQERTESRGEPAKAAAAPDPEAVEGAGTSDEPVAPEPPDLETEKENDEEALSFAREITSDVEEDDFRSHYDLGMAYIEMALFDDAVKELQIASRSEQLHLRSIEMIGHCFLMQDNPRLAVKQLERGLMRAGEGAVESLGIHYNLGLAYEMLDEADKAREYFEEVYIVDVTFRDVAEKMKKYSDTQ